MDKKWTKNGSKIYQKLTINRRYQQTDANQNKRIAAPPSGQFSDNKCEWLT